MAWKRIGEVEVFDMAGSPIPPSVAEAFVKQGIKPQNVYGMTENSSHQYTQPSDDTDYDCRDLRPRRPRLRGETVRSYRQRSRGLRRATVGQIAGKGRRADAGLFGNQDATESSFNRDGWFLSGDSASSTSAAISRIEGRRKGPDHPRRP